jgi:uncharacterized protein
VKIVLDTNVLLSGLFFGGQPLRIVEACLGGTVQFVTSPEIWAEYEQAAAELAKDRPLPALPKLLLQLAAQALVIETLPLKKPICRDPDDDKFIACALSAGADCIVSGDKDLHAVRLPGLQVLTPRTFIEDYLERGT